ncbi:hypothetical protein [Paenibacillus elgii]|uniref:hypothetical protein n=1 Tax=Paenibacillus elgii TaxID=189691 RepID=UPI0013D50668|nr:hypothetical protein [Paenibacillus elgii]
MERLYEALSWIKLFAQEHLVLFIAIILSLGVFLSGWAVLTIALHWQRSMPKSSLNRKALPWNARDAPTEWKPRFAGLRYIGRHLSTLLPLSSEAEKYAVGIFVSLSLLFGLFVATRVSVVFVGWNSDLPYNSFSVWFPVFGGVFAAVVPFLIIHSIIQARRVKLSHDLLPYIEEFERQVLAAGSARSAIEKMVSYVEGPFKDMTYQLIHALQRNHPPYIIEVLELFQHRVGTKFAHVFAVLVLEGLGVGQPYGKDIRVGLRALVEKMHLQQQTQDTDKPKKRELSQIGLITFPALFGFHWLAKGLLLDKTHYYMFTVPSQLNILVASCLFGCIAFTCNIIYGRRKLDL